MTKLCYKQEVIIKVLQAVGWTTEELLDIRQGKEIYLYYRTLKTLMGRTQPSLTWVKGKVHPKTGHVGPEGE